MSAVGWGAVLTPTIAGGRCRGKRCPPMWPAALWGRACARMGRWWRWGRVAAEAVP